MTFKHKPERRVQDYPRDRIKFPDPKKYGTPPFSDEKSARAYITAVHKYKEEDIQRLLAWYMPTLFDCGCYNPHEDSVYGRGLRHQYVCDGFYRCSTCGYERNPDGSKYIRKQRVSDVDIAPEKLDGKQLSLLEWKEERNEE